MNLPRPLLSALLPPVLLLAGCGGGDFAPAPVSAPQAPRIELLTSSSHGIESLAFKDGNAFLALTNTPSQGSRVLHTGLPLRAGQPWSDVALGACAMGPANEFIPPRPARLAVLDGRVWLHQPWTDFGADSAEHALCTLDQERMRFSPRDEALRVCHGGYCTTLSMTELKQHGRALLSNAGGGTNVLVSDDQGTQWRPLLGALESVECSHPVFETVGDRLLVGGECPLDNAFLRAYRLGGQDGKPTLGEEMPVTLPKMENRNVHFIKALPDGRHVFAGVEGGLLRSVDGGQSFSFAIVQPIDSQTSYPYIQVIHALASKPSTVLAGGFDKANGRPYLAWSTDAGATWSDLSALLPAAATATLENFAQVTSIAQDPDGRILVTMNEKPNGEGRLLHLDLGKR